MQANSVNNSVEKLPPYLRGELDAYLEKNKDYKPRSHLEFVNGKWKHDGQSDEQTPRQRVFEFAFTIANQLNLPPDIRGYIDRAGAVRLQKHGFKKAIGFIESRSKFAAAALSVLPEKWFHLDSEAKRARAAVKLAGHCLMQIKIATEKGLSPMNTIHLIGEVTMAALWFPAVSNVADDNQAMYLIHRLGDEVFCRRAIERQVVAAFEGARRAAGMVSPHMSPYASRSACEWLRIRQDRQRAWLEMMAIESDDGVQIDMTAVAESSQSNPANRRYELMTRIAGCQEYAEANEHIAIAVTMTAPSRFHRLRQNGNHWIENKKYDGSSPKQAQEWLCHTWIRFRAFADRRGFTYYGMRVVEPHQDGTPHWHAVFFMPLDQVGRFNAGLERYMLGKGRDLYELYFDDGKPKSKAMRARFHTQMIDGAAGGAVAYLAKYISKNVDGHALEGVTDSDAHAVKLQEVVKNVTAWSRAFCFRQFQFQRTPSVTVWRELRRIQEKQEWCLFEKARRAADMGFFSAYFDYMGGHRLRQSERPITTYKREKQNRYGEFVSVVKGLEGSGLVVFTHETEWKMVKKDSALAEAEKGSGSDRPWSRGNNCTVPSKGQRIIDNYYLSLELDGFDVAHQEWVKSENVGFGVLEAVSKTDSPFDYARQKG